MLFKKSGNNIILLDEKNERKCPGIKKLIRSWLLIAVSVCTVIVSAAALKAPEKSPSVDTSLSDAGVYTLRYEDGVIDIYSSGRVVFSADMDVSLLRSADREMLIRGVSVATWDEALGLIEDFSH